MRCALFLILFVQGKVILSRGDLRNLADKPDLAQFIMATIVWGYTSGGRGNNIKNVIECGFNDLKELLSEVRTQTAIEWNFHYKRVRKIKGIGLSTHTKFLNFLPVKVDGYQPLILDDRMIRVASQSIWKELDSLRELRGNPIRSYPTYLKEVHRIANSLEVSAEAIEFFLFEFGLNLKQSTC
jgi:hypothetical protein